MKLEQISREWMLRGAISRMSTNYKRKTPLWSLVADICCVGCTSASEICRELGWNPDAKGTDGLPCRGETGGPVAHDA